MALKPCTVCKVPTQGSRCPEHAKRTGRGYGTAGHRRFREEVLARNPICVLCYQARATVADHYPQSRRERVDLGLDPDDPANGRGLCKRCHDTETAKHQPGGWNNSHMS